MQCPPESTLADLLAGTLPDARTTELERHLSTCATCQLQLEQLAGGSPPTDLAVDETLVLVPASPLADVVAELKSRPERGSRSEDLEDVDLQALLEPVDGGPGLGRLGDYLVEEVLGQGGMGIVLKAYDASLDRRVAIKMLLPELARRRAFRDRFVCEAKAAASIQHPHVVTVHAVGETDTTPYLVMEYVAGETLADRIRNEGHVGLQEAVNIALDVLRGLTAAHDRGLIHRDIKPANVLIDGRTGAAKITDFGLVKILEDDQGLTFSGTVAGTPEFMSPEQALAEAPLDARSDLFSLGTLLYFALAGLSPFRGSSTLSTLRRVCDERPPSLTTEAPEVPRWLANVVHRLMEKSPTDRYASAREVIAELEGGGARPSSKPRWTWPVLGAAALSLMFAGLLWATYPWGRSSAPEASEAFEALEGFRVVGQEAVHASLDAAVNAATEGDVIEVHGRRVFAIPSLQVDAANLSIRAAAGALPTFVMADRAAGPAITASGLSIEGIRFEWTLEASSASTLEGCVIASPSGDLTVLNCEFDTTGRCSGIGATGSATVKNCHFRTADGSGMLVLPAAQERVAIENCLFEGRVGIAVADSLEGVGGAIAELRLRRNSFRTEAGIQLFHASRTDMFVDVEARQNDFAVTSHVIGYSGLRRLEAMVRALEGFKRRLSWVIDEGNRYDEASRMLVVQHRNGEVVSSIEDYQQWCAFWELERSLPTAGAVGVDEQALGPGAPRGKAELEK